LLVRKERWLLSARAWLLLTALFLGGILASKVFLYSFLAVTHPASSQFLIVEGWAPPYCLRQVAAIARTGQYRRIFTTGGLALEEWGVPPGETYAGLAAQHLKALGVSSSLIQAVPAGDDRRDRTYSSALALKKWCQTNHLAPPSFDLLTEGAHARRSRLLFQKAFGDDVTIGVIAVEDQTFDPARWWASSQGFRAVIGEAIAYFYARVLFHPSQSAA
jgi:uncharacterized SAM-binding protein YcdF (DUF218 family)